MKFANLSLVAAMTAGLCSVSSADSLTEALQAGKFSGEVTATYEMRNFDKNYKTTDPKHSKYYRDSGYSVGSFALKYESGVWNNLGLTSKFRAYANLFEDSSSSDTGKGTGDASGRFHEIDDLGASSKRSVDIEELFLTYAPAKNVTVKAGRQPISSHWFNKTQDGVKVDAAFGNTSLEAIWSLRHGRIYSRDYRPMTKFNENKGAYQIALTHKFNDMISVTAYDYIAPDLRDIIGGKVNLKLDNASFGVHYASSDEEKATTYKDSDFLHVTASTSIAGFTPYAGYAKVDDDYAFPGYYNATDRHDSGETDVPFEEGDYFYSKGAETFYLGVSKSFGDLSATLLYGYTEYLDSANKKQDMDETTLWLGYPVTKELKANLGLTHVNETDVANHGDYDQLNVTLAYSF